MVYNIRGTTALSGLTDVTITTPASGNLLQYNSSTSKWVTSDTIPDNLYFRELLKKCFLADTP